MSTAFTGITAAAIAGLAAGPALAASPTWNVKSGGKGYKGAVKGALRAKTSASLQDAITKVTWKCSKGQLSASIPASKVVGASPVLAKVTAMKLSCAGGASVTLSKSTTLSARTYNSTNGTTAGVLKSVTFNLAKGPCKAKVNGINFPVTFGNTGHSLSVDPHKLPVLTFRAVAFCPGFNKGDPAYIHGIYTVNAPAKLSISES